MFHAKDENNKMLATKGVTHIHTYIHIYTYIYIYINGLVLVCVVMFLCL